MDYRPSTIDYFSCVLLTGLWEPKREDVGARHNREILLAFDAVGDWSGRNGVAGVAVARRLSGFRVERAHLSGLLGRKVDSAGGRHQAGPVVIRANGFV